MQPEGSSHPYTITFAKTGDVRFLSHLDLVRMLERGLRRSALPLRFTQGFNPHVKISLSDALPVGVESVAEQLLIHLDVEWRAADVRAQLDQVLPAGVRVVSVEAGDVRTSGAANRWVLLPWSLALESALEESLGEPDERGEPLRAYVARVTRTETGVELVLIDHQGGRLRVRDLVAKIRNRDPTLGAVTARKLP